MIDMEGERSESRDALIAEKQTYERIHSTTKTILAEVGVETKNEAVIELLEATGLAGYDSTVSRIYLLPELIDRSLDSAAKTFVGDEVPIPWVSAVFRPSYTGKGINIPCRQPMMNWNI